MRESNQRSGAMEEAIRSRSIDRSVTWQSPRDDHDVGRSGTGGGFGSRSYERSQARRGYRNGKRQRSISTGLGATVIELPRARIDEGSGGKGMAERVDRGAINDQALWWIKRYWGVI